MKNPWTIQVSGPPTASFGHHRPRGAGYPMVRNRSMGWRTRHGCWHVEVVVPVLPFVFPPSLEDWLVSNLMVFPSRTNYVVLKEIANSRLIHDYTRINPTKHAKDNNVTKLPVGIIRRPDNRTRFPLDPINLPPTLRSTAPKEYWWQTQIAHVMDGTLCIW